MKRAAVVGGCRTPFVKAGTAFSGYSFLELGKFAVQAAVSQRGLDPSEIDELIFSTVLLDPRVPNFARELVFRAGLPHSLPAHCVSSNCISGLVAVNAVAEGIWGGRTRSGLAGGAESMSNPTLVFRDEAQQLFLSLNRLRDWKAKLSLASGFRPRHFVPLEPSPREPSTGLTMGEHCELMAKEFSIGRREQDEIAARSHANAAEAQKHGRLAEEIVQVGTVNTDNLIRPDTSIDKLSHLKPVFDRSGSGTLTAGNSSALTDGASIVLLMEESAARERGREILGYIDAVHFSAIDPARGLLMAPAIAVPALLERCKLQIGDIDLFEIHEAFAAQVAANLKVWKDGWPAFPGMRPIGEIPLEKVNPNGGSIALGHPFAATGGRLVLAAINELRRRGKKRALISVCAAGAMAGAMLVSVP